MKDGVVRCTEIQIKCFSKTNYFKIHLEIFKYNVLQRLCQKLLTMKDGL